MSIFALAVGTVFVFVYMSRGQDYFREPVNRSDFLGY